MTQGDMAARHGSDAGTQSDASSTNQRSVEQAADLASRMARSDLSTATTGQGSGAATHERQPNIPTDAGRQGDAKPTHQNAIGHSADAASRAARSDLKDISTKQATDGSTPMRQPNRSHDAGRQGDTSLTDQRVMGPSADIASRVVRSDLSSLSFPQTADKGGRQLRLDQWSTIVEERESLVRSGTLVEPTPEEINAQASLIGAKAVSESAASQDQTSSHTEAHAIKSDNALQEWNEHSGIHHYFLSDHSKHRDQQEKDQDAFGHYLQLRAAYEKQGIQNPAQYLDDNIKDISFFGYHTPGHRDLITHLQKAEMELKSKGINPEIASFWAFVPRTMNYQDKLSNHALGRAIDIDPKYNAHIIDKSVISVIAAVTGVDLGQEQTSPIMRQASQVFQQTFGDGWINQQKQQLEQLRSKGSPFPAVAKEIGRLQNLLHTVDHRRSEFNKYSQVGFFNLSQHLIDALTSAGFKWGGDYKTQKDFMHFELPHQSQPHTHR